MFYEEKMINGVLCYRNSPNEEFVAYKLSELSQRYFALQKHCEDLTEKINAVENWLDYKVNNQAIKRPAIINERL
jgi:hypothetical protein